MSEEQRQQEEASTQAPSPEQPQEAPVDTVSDAVENSESPSPKEPVKEEVTAETVKKQLGDAGNEIEALKAELAVLDNKKEKAFKQKQEVGSKIAARIKEINTAKVERNSLTQEVRGLKKERDELNKQINEHVQEIKKLTGGKPMPRMKTQKGEESPAQLKKQIEQLEYRLETQPMGFEAETKVNKEIKDLKKKLAGKMKAFEGMENVLAKSKEIDGLKKQANELHAKVTKLAADSQKRHEDLIGHSKEIEDLKKEEEALYNTFLEYKKAHGELSAKLRTKTGVALDDEKENVRKERSNAKKEKEAQDKKTLKERAKEAEDKVKKKQKLTTEDLLAMQGMK